MRTFLNINSLLKWRLTNVPLYQESEIMGFWVFGYGSLVWNPGFEYDEKIMGFIKDYRRVFDVGKFL